MKATQLMTVASVPYLEALFRRKHNLWQKKDEGQYRGKN